MYHSIYVEFDLNEDGEKTDMLQAKVLRLLAFLIQYGKEEPQPVLYGEEKKCMQPVKSAITYVQMHFGEHMIVPKTAYFPRIIH